MRIEVPPGRHVRPTPDRVRETLFNWLAPHVEGARCLDLFAGTGALGLEAASRGARSVCFVESDREVAQALRLQARRLAPGALEVVHADATSWLQQSGSPFDIVFLDPPYARAMIPPSLASLQARGWLAQRCLIYLEHSWREEEVPLPPEWRLVRESRAGRVCFRLAQRG